MYSMAMVLVSVAGGACSNFVSSCAPPVPSCVSGVQFPPFSAQTVMLLSLILSDKERRLGGGSGQVEDIVEGREGREDGQEGDGAFASGSGGEKSSAICVDDDTEGEDGDDGARTLSSDSKRKKPHSSGGGGGGSRRSIVELEGEGAVESVLPRKRGRPPAPTTELPSSEQQQQQQQ